MAQLLAPLIPPGNSNRSHTYWVFPLCVQDPQGLSTHLMKAGFDATHGASNLMCVSAGNGRALAAQELLQRVVYLPVYPEIPSRQLERLARLTKEFVAGPVNLPKC